ncbi:hypothetical protein [Pseudofrankia inefficax]|uniref:Uncharacterized protein n=1 Tax=Pseudofrankia inefficax (strain DSM 45817 / CECT 9037 / DDB 130130 / EuI1c) TaxID=298654 RepID=E3J3V2_PSEI1|nr:hypothetical protein [Pseudofrankia inefficax]ADP80585.1 hypothetical protein FraEuI1c_2551 [Pseudofrankia inefficax]
MIRLTDRARAALRDGEMIVFDWAALGVCCGCTGHPWLRTAPRAVALRSRRLRPVAADPAGSVLAHPRAYPDLVGRDVVVDCRHRFGFRRFSSDLPQGLDLTGRHARPVSTAGSGGRV